MLKERLQKVTSGCKGSCGLVFLKALMKRSIKLILLINFQQEIVD